MIVVSWNVNGLLACMRKGGFEQLSEIHADIICCQEIKTKTQVDVLHGYQHFWLPSQRNGYAGVLTLTKYQPLHVSYGVGDSHLDEEGRFLVLEFPSFFCANAYFPNSEGGTERKKYRSLWETALFRSLLSLEESKPVILCGDFNVTRTPADIYAGNTRMQNAETGYMKEERAFLERLLDSGYTDAFRQLYPDQKDAFTWWSARFDKRGKNDGWRLDYFFVSKKIAKTINSVHIYRDILGSDHCPIGLKIGLFPQATTHFDKHLLAGRKPNIDFPDAYLGALWDNTDWERAEAELRNSQRELAGAAARKDMAAVTALQKKIVRSTDSKQLAVRKVCAGHSGPGVDGVKWKTSSEKMRAALLLSSAGYRAQPLRNVKTASKATKKERIIGIPTYYDRAMQVLYGYSLAPILETWGDSKSFSFRPGRSMLDASAYILDALSKSSWEYVLLLDVEAYYANIHHDWLMENVPMDKKVLREFLRAGYVFAGELFPEEDAGISLGANLSPLLGNFVLDGLEDYLRDLWDGPWEMVRFADDIFITIPSVDMGERVWQLAAGFLRNRGLTLSSSKSKICSVYEGFSFLSLTYKKIGERFRVTPARYAVARLKNELSVLILSHNRSQRDLILSVNRKLRGWAAYYRYFDAMEVFEEVDSFVDSLLIRSSTEKHPNMARKKVLHKYWFFVPGGKRYYALPENRDIHVMRLGDVILIGAYEKVRTDKNPYLSEDYFLARANQKLVTSVSGKYKSIWKRQQGRCFYCGRPILSDQPRMVTQMDLSLPPVLSNLAYIHSACQWNDVSIRKVEGDVSVFTQSELLEGQQEIGNHMMEPKGKKIKGPLTDRWIHMKLKRWFAKQTSASITLTFSEIEKIDGRPLTASARKSRSNWYTRPDQNAMAEAWVTEGYRIERLNLEKEKVTFKRTQEGVAHVNLPAWVTRSKIPDPAKAEIENFLSYIQKKYGL